MRGLLAPVALLVVLVAALAGGAAAEAPVAAAEALRLQAGRIERLAYRSPTPERQAEIGERLSRMQAAWADAAPAYGEGGAAVAAALDRFAHHAGAGEAAGVARWRQRLWLALATGARDAALAALRAGDGATAEGWLAIRDYARASGDTAASQAVAALRAGRLSPADAAAAVEAELLGIAAAELRLALARAAEDAAAGRMIQYAGDLGRAEGLADFLAANLAARLGAEAAAALAAELARAATEPAAIAAAAARLARYAPVALAPAERLRRARLLRRFTALVGEEYRDGVRDGAVTVALEYNEALLFRERAAMVLGDLAGSFDDPAAADRLGVLMAEMAAIMAAKGDGIEARVVEALALIDASFGAEVAAGGFAAALDAALAALDELVLMAGQGDWAGAELKRLEAYSWFDPDIEQRLVPRAPAMALRLEARFWEGSAGRPGLGRLMAVQAPAAAVAAEAAGIRADLAAARTLIEAPLSATGAVLQSAAILFREGLEAVLILAALFAALRAEGADPARFRAATAAGVVAALAASLALWAAARWLFALSTLTREAIEGATALLAAAVLVWLVLGLAAKGGHVAALRRRLAGRASAAGVAALAFLVVFREGFETVLFYEALLVDAAPAPVLGGLLAGAAAAGAAGWLVLVSGRRLPLGLLFRATSAMLAVLAVMLVGAGVRGLQTAALIGATPVAWFPDRDWLQLWLGLFPVAEPLVAQAATILVLLAPALRRRPAPA